MQWVKALFMLLVNCSATCLSWNLCGKVRCDVVFLVSKKREREFSIKWFLNPFLGNAPILYPLKSVWFSCVFRRYEMRTLTRNGSKVLLLNDFGHKKSSIHKNEAKSSKIALTLIARDACNLAYTWDAMKLLLNITCSKLPLSWQRLLS